MWASSEILKKETHQVETGQNASMDLGGQATKIVMLPGLNKNLLTSFTPGVLLHPLTL